MRNPLKLIFTRDSGVFCSVIPAAETLPCRIKYDGTILNTGTATCATVFDDSSGPFFDFDLEIAGRSRHAFQVCIGDQFDV
jgi:hypothetical protein